MIDPVCAGNGQLHNAYMAPVANTLDTMHDAQIVVGRADSTDNQEPVVYPGVGITSLINQSNPAPGDPAPTLSTDSRNYLVQPNRKYIVRRLTPLECCRLQGFPDWWEDGVEGSDSARYKMWGNGIALPCAADVLRRIAKQQNKEDSTT